jgi:hypothetical protein
MSVDSDLLVFLVVVAARLLVPLGIPRYPLPAIIAAMIIDGIDQTIFQVFTEFDLTGYQGYDKALDIYYLSVAYMATLRNWTHLFAFQTSRFLYFYRLVGNLIFELTQIRPLLLIFPNTFEYFFDFYEAVRLRWNPLRLSKRLIVGAAAFIWIFIKLPQEYWIHVAQLDTTDLIKEQIFGVPTDTPWREIVADNIGVFLGLIIVIVLLIAAAAWFIRSKLPPADWRLSFDADGHGRDVTDEQVDAASRALAGRFFDTELLEKIVLVGLVTVIFAQVLPGVRASNLQVAIGVALLIIANSAVSRWLVGQGVSWASGLRQFMTMAVINLAIVVVFYLVLPLRSGSINLGNTLFFVLLLTLLVVLYDRYRPYYLARLTAAKAAQ